MSIKTHSTLRPIRQIAAIEDVCRALSASLMPHLDQSSSAADTPKPIASHFERLAGRKKAAKKDSEWLEYVTSDPGLDEDLDRLVDQEVVSALGFAIVPA